MPTAIHQKHRIQRHFPLLTIQTRFSSERLLTPPPLTIQTVFPVEVETPSPPSSPAPSSPLSPVPDKRLQGSSGTDPNLIPKPSGSVCHPGGKGYSLRSKVPRWDDKKFLEVQVTLPLLWCPLSVLIRFFIVFHTLGSRSAHFSYRKLWQAVSAAPGEGLQRRAYLLPLTIS